MNDFNKQLLNDMISAYRKGYSCQSSLYKLSEEMRYDMGHSETVAMTLMDLSKAFDCLPHDLMMIKLLGPCLFNLFLNDFMYILENSSPVNYADDNILLATGKTLMEAVEDVKKDTEAAHSLPEDPFQWSLSGNSGYH